jgi:hypothetical protein
MSGSRLALSSASLFSHPVLRSLQIQNRQRENVYLYDIEHETEEHVLAEAMHLDSGFMRFFHYLLDALLIGMVAKEITGSQAITNLLLVTVLTYDLYQNKGVKPDGLVGLPFAGLPLHYFFHTLDQNSFSEGAVVSHDYISRTPVYKGVNHVMHMSRDDFYRAPEHILELAKTFARSALGKADFIWEKLPSIIKSFATLIALAAPVQLSHDYDLISYDNADRMRVLIAPVLFFDYAMRTARKRGIFVASIEDHIAMIEFLQQKHQQLPIPIKSLLLQFGLALNQFLIKDYVSVPAVITVGMIGVIPMADNGLRLMNNDKEGILSLAARKISNNVHSMFAPHRREPIIVDMGAVPVQEVRQNLRLGS